LWIGYEASYDDRQLEALRETLYRQSRRVFSTWAPTVDTLLFLRGSIDVVAAYRCSGQELLGALLIMQEAGAVLRGANGSSVTLPQLPLLTFAGIDEAVLQLIASLPRSLRDA
jgi:fructose-1,6-bisphosphatase/inositol monophosphatase family enzyme